MTTEEKLKDLCNRYLPDGAKEQVLELFKRMKSAGNCATVTHCPTGYKCYDCPLWVLD